MLLYRAAGAALHAAAAVLTFCNSAAAQDAADFYRGKTINLIAGFNPGGGADTYARLVARHLGAHVAGNPAVVVRNMQGAGSVVAANYVFNVSPKDGTELGLFAGNIVIDPLDRRHAAQIRGARLQLDRRAVLGFQRTCRRRRRHSSRSTTCSRAR